MATKRIRGRDLPQDDDLEEVLEGSVDVLELTPPSEIGEGNSKHSARTAALQRRKSAATSSFGSLPTHVKRTLPREGARSTSATAPDKRTRPEPVECKIPPRFGGPVLF